MLFVSYSVIPSVMFPVILIGHAFCHCFCHLFCHPFYHPFCHHLRHDLVGDRLFVYRRPIYRLLGSAAYRRDHQILLF